MAGDPKARDRLDSWKEIASYLGRSVRTARRWEAEEGLPVHRHMHKSQGTVYAYRSEIDLWRTRGDSRPETPRPGTMTSSPAANLPPERSSIAVLPFGYVGPEGGSEYLADGFTEEVIAKLSQLGALRVISRTSSMALKGTRKDARTLGRDLGVRHLLEGTVRQEGARIRVSARLIDPASDARLWGETYQGSLDDVFDIQDQIARQIVGSLHLHLTEDEDRRLSARPRRNVVAWQCALHARQEALRWRRDSIDRAVQLLENGLSTVGDEAGLHAALGRTYLQYREAAIDLGEAPLEKAERCAERSFALDPAAAAGHQLRGWIGYGRGEIQSAVVELKRALAIDGNDPDTLGLLANCYLISGRVSIARPIIDRLLAVDPLTPLNRCLPGWADALEGDARGAIGPYREMLEMDPANPLARLFYLWILASAGRVDQAREVAEGFPSAESDSLPGRIASLFAHGLAGTHPGRAATLTPDVEPLARSNDMFPRFLAQAYALGGDSERALHWVAIAVDRGFINYPFLAQHDPLLGRLRAHPRYADLLHDVRGRWRAFEP